MHQQSCINRVTAEPGQDAYPAGRSQGTGGPRNDAVVRCKSEPGFNPVLRHPAL